MPLCLTVLPHPWRHSTGMPRARLVTPADRWFKHDDACSVSVRRWPALTFAVLVMWGLLSRQQVLPAFAPEALPGMLRVAICHTGPDQPRNPNHPVADCEACLLCQAPHGDHATMLLLPLDAELPLMRIATRTRADVPVPLDGRTNRPLVPSARAPPSRT